MKALAEFAKSREVILAQAPAGEDFVLGDEDLLARAFHALLETAVKFSVKGETVRISRAAIGRFNQRDH